MSNWLTLKKNRTYPARYLPLEKGRDFKCSDSLLNVIDDSQSTLTEDSEKELKSLLKKFVKSPFEIFTYIY